MTMIIVVVLYQARDSPPALGKSNPSSIGVVLAHLLHKGVVHNRCMLLGHRPTADSQMLEHSRLRLRLAQDHLVQAVGSVSIDAEGSF